MQSELPKACIGFDEDLSALIDEELPSSREAELRAHLDGCDRCARRLEELCNVDLELAGLAQPLLSPEVARGLRARIALEGAAEAQGAGRATGDAGRRAPPSERRRWLAGSARARIALAAGVALLAWLFVRGEPRVVSESPTVGFEPQAPLARLEAPLEPGAPSEQAPAGPVAEQPDRPEVAGSGGVPGPGVGGSPELAELPIEDLAMLLELGDVQDLDLIANLELLETLVDLERGAG